MLIVYHQQTHVTMCVLNQCCNTEAMVTDN